MLGDESPLGVVPHQIRGALSFFRTDCMLGRAFGKCTACSATVTDAYAARGFDFLLDAFNGGGGVVSRTSRGSPRDDPRLDRD